MGEGEGGSALEEAEEADPRRGISLTSGLLGEVGPAAIAEPAELPEFPFVPPPPSPPLPSPLHEVEPYLAQVEGSDPQIEPLVGPKQSPQGHGSHPPRQEEVNHVGSVRPLLPPSPRPAHPVLPVLPTAFIAVRTAPAIPQDGRGIGPCRGRQDRPVPVPVGDGVDRDVEDVHDLLGGEGGVDRDFRRGWGIASSSSSSSIIRPSPSRALGRAAAAALLRGSATAAPAPAPAEAATSNSSSSSASAAPTEEASAAGNGQGAGEGGGKRGIGRRRSRSEGGRGRPITSRQVQRQRQEQRMEGTEGDEEGAVAVAVAGSSLPGPERRLGQSSGGGHRTTVGCCRRSWGHRGFAFFWGGRGGGE